MNAQPMETAPRDGTRVLINRHNWVYNSDQGRWITRGTSWVECWWIGEKWQRWLGARNMSSTDHVDPICWAPLPDERHTGPAPD